MSLFEGKQLMCKDETLVDAMQVVSDAKVIAVYFSAHWCPPCRGFTPVLKDFYEGVKDEGVCIIFVSSDRSEDDMKSYFKEDHGSYYALPFADRGLAQTLKSNCNVQGIPMLCLVNKKGDCIYSDGRNDVQEGGGNPKITADSWAAKY